MKNSNARYLNIAYWTVIATILACTRTSTYATSCSPVTSCCKYTMPSAVYFSYVHADGSVEDCLFYNIELCMGPCTTKLKYNVKIDQSTSIPANSTAAQNDCSATVHACEAVNTVNVNRDAHCKALTWPSTLTSYNISRNLPVDIPTACSCTAITAPSSASSCREYRVT